MAFREEKAHASGLRAWAKLKFRTFHTCAKRDFSGAYATNLRHLHRHEGNRRHHHERSLHRRSCGSVRNTRRHRGLDARSSYGLVQSSCHDRTARNSRAQTEPNICGSVPDNRGSVRNRNAAKSTTAVPADCKTSVASSRGSGCRGCRCSSPVAAMNCRVVAARTSAGYSRHG